MDAFDAIYQRRSVKHYDPTHEFTDAEINKLMEAAIQSPSSFNIQNWENRIYCYEPGVRYSFLFPAWYGSGSQNLIVATLKTERSLTFRGKVGVTHYNDKHEIGSGSDIYAGDRMLSFELQLEIKM